MRGRAARTVNAANARAVSVFPAPLSRAAAPPSDPAAPHAAPTELSFMRFCFMLGDVLMTCEMGVRDVTERAVGP
jgi:hypothetical protein